MIKYAVCLALLFLPCLANSIHEDTLSKECENKNSTACFELGKYYLDSNQTEKGIDAYTNACNYGDARVCYILGFIYEQDRIVQRDKNNAIYFYQKACDLNHYGACVANGLLFRNDDTLPNHNQIASELFTKACNENVNLGCRYDGLLQTSLRKYQKANDSYLKGCNNGDAPSCILLGMAYEYGEGVDKNAFKAFDFYERGCLKNEGCYFLGSMYHDGKGVRQNYPKAFKIYKKSCDMKESNGCMALGMMYEFGQGMAKNLKVAKELYGQACDLQNEMGCSDYKRLNR